MATRGGQFDCTSAVAGTGPRQYTCPMTVKDIVHSTSQEEIGSAKKEPASQSMKVKESRCVRLVQNKSHIFHFLSKHFGFNLLRLKFLSDDW